jgi:hypothetical protein
VPSTINSDGSSRDSLPPPAARPLFGNPDDPVVLPIGLDDLVHAGRSQTQQQGHYRYADDVTRQRSGERARDPLAAGPRKEADVDRGEVVGKDREDAGL